MNYDDSNRISDYLLTEIFPLCKPRISDYVENLMVYLERLHRQKGAYLSYNLMSLPIFIDPPLFLKKYQNKLIQLSTPADPNNGVLSFIHQISITLHTFSRLYCWIENNNQFSHLIMLVSHKDFDEYLDFYNSVKEYSKTGNTSDFKDNVGFKTKT